MTAATADFFDALEKSGLLGGETLGGVRRRMDTDPAAAAGGEIIAKHLLDERLLTRFQAKQLLAGRHRGFFIAEKYKILELLGEGGMGRVLLCEHVLMQRLVALKLMQGAIERHASALDRFLREARAAASLSHPNIAQVFDVDRSERGPYIVMEYVDGTDLHRLTARHGALSIERAVHYVRQAAAGLQHAHEAGLVHRDVKPLNLMLDRTGNVKLLDLGLARFFDADKNDKLTQQHDVSAIIGTADFIAPEQALESSTADIRADIYSLGLTLYFLLTAKLPYGRGKAIQKLLWHQVREPEPIRNVRDDMPEELAAVLERMIRKQPDERFQTPGEVVRALEPWASTTVAPPKPEEMPPIPPSAYRLGLSSSRAKESVTGPTSAPAADGSGSKRGSGASSASYGISPSGVTKAPLSDVKPAVSSNPAVRSPAPAAAAKSQLDAWFDDELASLGGPAAPAKVPPRPPLQPPRRTNSSTAAPSLKSLRSMPPWVGKSAAVVGCFLVIGLVVRFLWLREDPRLLANREMQAALWRSTDGDPTPAAPAVPASDVVLHGGGSTFVRPIMEHWSQTYQQRTGVRIDYVGVGSSKGIEGVTSKLLDFGCSDAFLNDEQLAAAGSRLLHVPLVLGAVVPTYNLTLDGEVKSLRFTGPVLVGIYLGAITRWNDPAIAVNNPGVKLPDLAITPVYRSDGSGTTSIWTDYLAKAGSAWKDQVGVGTKVTWPVGVGADKNNGIADTVSRTNGAIGYVELSYALANGLPVGQVKNAAGMFVTPSIESVTAAAASLRSVPDDLRFSLTDAPGAAAYPIVGTAWALLYVQQPYGKGKELAEFLRWATTDGQTLVSDLHYGPLPPDWAERIRSTLDELDAGR
jgi:phosphate ABC transporter phosphate-binding protein